MTPHHLTHTHQTLEARLAGRLASSLTLSSATLPHHVNERLRVARDQAVAQARLARQAQAAAAVTHAGGGTAVVQGGPRSGRALPQWLLALMPLLLLLAGLLLIDQLNVQEQIRVAADIDTLVLGDELPPAAYADPGFVHYLRWGPTP